MLAHRAVQAFLNRERRDVRNWKLLNSQQLDAEMGKLPIRPPIWNKLYRHQQACFLLGAKHRRFAFFIDTGTGKSFLSIALVRYFAKLGEAKHFLVLVPNKINKAEWQREIKKHSPKTSVCILSGSSKNKWLQLEENHARITVETYAGLVRMVSELLPSKKGRNKLQPSPKLVRAFTKLIDGLVLDESNSCKTKRALIFRICRQLSKKANNVFALSGTPFGNEPIDLWGQMYLVDGGHSLGETMGLFREVFYTQTTDPFGRFKYNFVKAKRKLLHTMLAHQSIRYLAEQADLPTVVAIKKFVTLPGDAGTYYQKAREALRIAKGNYQETKNVFLRMRQISSGFLGYKDDETGTRAEFEFAQNPKLELLLSIIGTLPQEHKVLIFHDFVFAGSIICRELKKEGIGHVRLFGRKTDDPTVLLDKFDNDPNCRVFVLNTSGAYGLNLQKAKYAIFFESPVSVILRKQMQRRIERQGSEHKRVFVYDLICKGTVDEQVLAAHAAGTDLFKAVIEGQINL